MIEVACGAQKEKELLAQELEHCKKQRSELRQREQELSDQLTNHSKVQIEDQNQRESDLKMQLSEALASKKDLEETVQDLTEKLENSKLTQDETQQKLND